MAPDRINLVRNQTTESRCVRIRTESVRLAEGVLMAIARWSFVFRSAGGGPDLSHLVEFETHPAFADAGEQL